jgi:hypothetical protein
LDADGEWWVPMECHEVDILQNLIVSAAWLDHEPGRKAICLAMDLPVQGHRPLPGQIRAVTSTALAVASFSFDQVLRRSTPPISPPDAYTCLRASLNERNTHQVQGTGKQGHRRPLVQGVLRQSLESEGRGQSCRTRHTAPVFVARAAVETT